MRLKTGLMSLLFAVLVCYANAEDNTVGGGLNLFPASLPDDAMYEDGIALPDGTWWMEAYLPESGFVLEAKRRGPIPFDAKAVLRHIATAWSEAEDMRAAEFPELAEKLSYPVIKASFLTGANEDTRLHTGAFVFTDEWTFWFDVAASVDTPFEDMDASEEPLERLEREMTAFLMTVDCIRGDGRYFPETVAPVYLPGGGALPALDISLVDALVRIKRMAIPEPEYGMVGVAYRYDGIADVPASGRPCLLFSFGADSPEKFTAERHFAVDNRGIVYEMDILSGGDYEPIVDSAPKYWEGDDVPNWWGEYRDGEKLLRIVMFREGPVYFYLRFQFEIAGDVVGEDLAVVNYANVASFCDLDFHLESDDNAVRVAYNPESYCDGEEWTRRCIGTYLRAE